MKISELLKDWGIEKKVFTITVDNASANDSMQAHILNLIVQDGLDVISGALDKIRDSVKYVRGSQTRENLFQNCMETFKDALCNLAEVDKSYKSLPSDLEWERAELICELLQPFAELTKMISGSSYPTANLYFMQVWAIKCWLRDHEDSSDPVICDMVENMNEKYEKYWEEFSDILAIAAVFDPRLKFAFLEFCYNILDPSTTKSKLAHVRKKMDQLFGAYKKDTSNVASTSKVSRRNVPFGYDGFYTYFSQKHGGNGKSPLDTYLEESGLDMVQFKNLNLLSYWKDNSGRFKELALMACDVLSIPLTTVASESAFSIGSRVLNKYRSCLLPSNVQALICARNWVRGFEELGDEFEFVEEEGTIVAV
ncbi:PREDICTED: zinc finger BED domain-containing protein RICESLEEPER 2-like [Camelina sativa]|uniref:Zinc finger BED domain-containing protein RICESLEEPER 2-like n=1 Tax=Camelina sativa TaxID=90675 RepID=A0ABM1QHP8_CAMSA|nr:PREDICTED: zinc finger BED domain-containing protein RICESLEEPER 2-like [Camelina sativa]